MHKLSWLFGAAYIDSPLKNGIKVSLILTDADEFNKAKSCFKHGTKDLFKCGIYKGSCDAISDEKSGGFSSKIRRGAETTRTLWKRWCEILFGSVEFT